MLFSRLKKKIYVNILLFAAVTIAAAVFSVFFKYLSTFYTQPSPTKSSKNFTLLLL